MKDDRIIIFVRNYLFNQNDGDISQHPKHNICWSPAILGFSVPRVFLTHFFLSLSVFSVNPTSQALFLFVVVIRFGVLAKDWNQKHSEQKVRKSWAPRTDAKTSISRSFMTVFIFPVFLVTGHQFRAHPPVLFVDPFPPDIYLSVVLSFNFEYFITQSCASACRIPE